MAVELHHEVHAGSGPYLLLVHGILSSRAQWRLNLAALSRIAQPVVVELWGHGRSPSPDDEALFTPEGFVEAFERLRRRLGAERWLVCGQSLGGALTLRYALDAPERLLAHVFTNSTSALGDEEWAATMRASVGRLSEAVESGGRAALHAMPIHPRNAKRFPPSLHEEMLADAAAVDPAAIARIFRRTIPESSSRGRIGENRVPTLLVAGDRETRFAAHREAAEQGMPLLEVVRADAGHAVNIEAADVFDAAVTAFVRKIVDRARPEG